MTGRPDGNHAGMGTDKVAAPVASSVNAGSISPLTSNNANLLTSNGLAGTLGY